jgi:hypothetical protein
MTMRDSIERLANHLQDALSHHEAEEYQQSGLALRAAIATLHQAAIEVAAKTAALDVESSEVHRLTGALHDRAKSLPQRKGGPALPCKGGKKWSSRRRKNNGGNKK